VKSVLFLFAIVLSSLIALPAMAGDTECANGRGVKNAVSIAANVATYPVRVIVDGLNDVDRCSRGCDQSQSVLSVVPFVVSGEPTVGYVAPYREYPSPGFDPYATGDLCQDSRIVQTYQRGYRVLSKREVQMISRLRKTRSCR
jgi:hypothetical protein